jgi:hypothetical protein
MLQGETANAALAKIAQYILTIEGQMRSASLSQQIAELGFAPAEQIRIDEAPLRRPGHYRGCSHRP